MGFNLADYQPVEDRLREFWLHNPGGPDPERLAEIATEHAMEVTGPVPDGYL